MQAEIGDKAAFFDGLYSLHSSSDSEDINDAREFLKQCILQPLSLSSSPSHQSPNRSQNARRIAAPLLSTSLHHPPERGGLKKIPAIQRTLSEPISSVKGHGQISLPRKHSLLRHDSVASMSCENLDVEEITQHSGDTRQRPEERRTVSNPTPGTLVLTNSTGIASMLGKRKKGVPKSKATPLKLLPEAQQIFRGLTFYYFPPNDKNTLRNKRIAKAREFGAIISTELTLNITHLIVENDFPLKDVLEYLKLKILPSSVIVVKEEYLIDCIDYRCLEDPGQEKYAVKTGLTAESLPEPPSISPTSQVSLQLKDQQSKPDRRETPQVEEPTQDAFTQICELTQEASYHDQPSVGDAPESQPIPANGALSKLPFGDELDNIIQFAKDLPIDDDDDEEESELDRASSRGEDGDLSDDGYESPTFKPKPKGKKRKRVSDQENFTCMKSGTGISENNYNNDTIMILDKMANVYKMLNDQWRERAYRQACGQLRRESKKITTYEEAVEIRFIGHRLASKIQEIVHTGRLRRLETAESEPLDAFLKLFLGIYDVGLSQASQWVQQGFRTLEDLKAKASLTPKQLMGIEHYNDLQTRIPRGEVAALGNVVKETAASIESAVEVIIGGSYRRGAQTSGDIDCLLTKPGTSSSQDLLPFLRKLVDQLTARGFLTQALATPWAKASSGSKWHGCCVLPGSEKPIWRRIDFLLVPATELGAALIYFTGDDIFNRSIRLLAGTKSMRLNQKGLYQDVMRGPKRAKMNQGSLMAGADEKDIFRILGVTYRKPEERIHH